MAREEKHAEHWCAHCQDKMIGFSQVGDDYLCHPSIGVDCYRLTEIYDHPMPCQPCTDVRKLLNQQITQRTMLMGVRPVRAQEAK